MNKTVLYIEVSPRGTASFSSRAAAAFLQGYAERWPEDSIERLDLSTHPLPEFDREAAEQKMQQAIAIASGTRLVERVGKWSAIEAEVDRLKAADKVVISTPMWNFSIPYTLKHYIDIVTQPGLTFSFTTAGEYYGLILGKPLQLILASGSAYAMRFPEAQDGTKTDFQRPYLEHMARFLGFTDVRVLKIQPTAAATPEQVAQTLAAKLLEARQLGRDF